MARVQRLDWNEDWMLVLHSDGLSTQWHWSDFAGLERERAQVVAGTLMRKLATKQDDATVLAARVRHS